MENHNNEFNEYNNPNSGNNGGGNRNGNNGNNGPGKKNGQTILVFIMFTLIAMLVMSLFSSHFNQMSSKETSYTEFITQPRLEGRIQVNQLDFPSMGTEQPVQAVDHVHEQKTTDGAASLVLFPGNVDLSGLHTNSSA